MKHRDYLNEINPYILLSGIADPQRNKGIENRIYEYLVELIKDQESPEKILADLELLLDETSKNYFCKGFKMGLQIAFSLSGGSLQEKEF